MASLEHGQNEDLRLAKLESEFYKTCSAVRWQGIEIENQRNSLLQELLEVEEKKNSSLNHELQRLLV